VELQRHQNARAAASLRKQCRLWILERIAERERALSLSPDVDTAQRSRGVVFKRTVDSQSGVAHHEVVNGLDILLDLRRDVLVACHVELRAQRGSETESNLKKREQTKRTPGRNVTSWFNHDGLGLKSHSCLTFWSWAFCPLALQRNHHDG